MKKSLKHSFRKDGNGDGFQQHSFFVFLPAVMPPSLLCGALFLEEWSPPSFQPGFLRLGRACLYPPDAVRIGGGLHEWKAHDTVWNHSSVIINLSVLGFFKYADFLIDTVNGLFYTGLRPLGLGLPVGISFFTFQTMSYSIDLYRRKVPVEKNYLTYLTYVSMFPQLVAGPIVRFSTVNQELHSRKIRRSEVTDGFYRFLQVQLQAPCLW